MNNEEYRIHKALLDVSGMLYSYSLHQDDIFTNYQIGDYILRLENLADSFRVMTRIKELRNEK